MPLNRHDPNVYSAALSCPASTGVIGAGIGFPATYLRFVNSNAVDIYVGLNSSTLATTEGLRVRACSEVTLAGIPPISVLTAYATSTGAASVLNVTALGG
jgi:hypothetical protein